MISVITLSLVVMAGVIAFSQFFYLSRELQSEKEKSRYMIFSFSLAVSAFLYAGMTMSYSSPVCFILYAIEKLISVVIMAEVVLLTMDMVDVEEKYVSGFISIVAFSAVGLLFVSVLAPGGQLLMSLHGVYFLPGQSWHQALYFLYYMFYVVILVTFVVYRGAVVVKNCEKHDLVLLLFVYIFTASGFLIEQFIVTYSLVFFPVSIFTNLVSLIIMRRLLVYHDSILLKESHFQKELDPGRTDVVFVIDDKLNIVFQNKRAQVLSVLNHDVFVGRKLTEVFEFTEGAFSQFFAQNNESAFGISADYEPTNRHVNIIVNHRIDNYGEILASVVFVYNMEELVKNENMVIEMQEEQEVGMITNALSITRDARILVVDEDVLFLNVFQRLLKPYEVVVTRAISGKDALNQVMNHVYDLIFIAYEMEKLNGVDTVKMIRSIPKDYTTSVPVVFLTVSNINEVFTGFLEAGFSDYLTKPISKRALNSVLTRWLWKRFEEENEVYPEVENKFSAQYNELSELLSDAEKMYADKKLDMLRFVMTAIKRDCRQLGLTDISELASGVDEAIAFEDYDSLGSLFDKMKKAIMEAITVM